MLPRIPCLLHVSACESPIYKPCGLPKVAYRLSQWSGKRETNFEGTVNWLWENPVPEWTCTEGGNKLSVLNNCAARGVEEYALHVVLKNMSRV